MRSNLTLILLAQISCDSMINGATSNHLSQFSLNAIFHCDAYPVALKHLLCLLLLPPRVIQ